MLLNNVLASPTLKPEDVMTMMNSFNEVIGPIEVSDRVGAAVLVKIIQAECSEHLRYQRFEQLCQHLFQSRQDVVTKTSS
eukprot:1343769-Amphidinium_carterae.1